MVIEMLGTALTEAGGRHGVSVVVANKVMKAMSAAPGQIVITISANNKPNSFDIVRRPLPHEGGVLHHYTLDAAVQNGVLGTDVAWIEQWALELAAIKRFGDALSSAGCKPYALPPWGVQADETLCAIISAIGQDLGILLKKANWRDYETGFTTQIASSTINAEIDRYLHIIRCRTLIVEIDERRVEYHEKDGEIALTIGSVDALPSTLLVAATGHPLSTIIELASKIRQPSNTIKTAEQSGSTLKITAEVVLQHVSIPSTENMK